ncbi:MAG: hypothetical protein ABI426_02045 [Flavobacterium sp.]
MKNLKFIIGAFILFFTLQSNAQVSVNVNIGSRPEWCGHYDDDVDYFYLPEIEAYYDVHSSVFIYMGPGGWIRTAYLPEYCRDYDLNHGYKVVLDYRGSAPYAYFNRHRQMYYHDYYRNYRQEYYHPRQPRRTQYVAMASPRDYHNNGNHNNHNNGQGGGHGNGNGHGGGHGHGRR